MCTRVSLGGKPGRDCHWVSGQATYTFLERVEWLSKWSGHVMSSGWSLVTLPGSGHSASPPVLPKSLHPLLPGGCPPSARTVSVPQVLGHGLRHATLVSHTEETVCWDAPGRCCKNISSDLRQLGREIWGLCFFLCEQGAGGHGCPRQSL